MAADLSLRILVQLSECKAALGLDDRDDDFTRFLLVTASAAAESHLGRRILRRRYTEYFDSLGHNTLPLKAYPVREIEAVHVDRERFFPETTRLDSERYYATPVSDPVEDHPSNLVLIAPEELHRAQNSIKVSYSAGYDPAEVPEDLKEAVIEIVAWNQTRYRSRRIGVAGAVRGTGKDTESLERTLPEYIAALLEPYRRRTV